MEQIAVVVFLWMSAVALATFALSVIRPKLLAFKERGQKERERIWECMDRLAWQSQTAWTTGQPGAERFRRAQRCSQSGSARTPQPRFSERSFSSGCTGSRRRASSRRVGDCSGASWALLLPLLLALDRSHGKANAAIRTAGKGRSFASAHDCSCQLGSPSRSPKF